MLRRIIVGAIATVGSIGLVGLSNTSAKAVTLQFSNNFNILDPGNTQTHSLTGIAVDSKENVFVSDYYHNPHDYNLSRVDMYNANNPTGTFTSFSASDFQPFGIAVDGYGNVFAADEPYEKIDTYNTSNPSATLTSFGNSGNNGLGLFDFPTAVAVDSKGNVFVVDNIEGNIDTYNISNPSGTFTSFSTYSANKQFRYPSNIAVDSKGNVIFDVGGVNGTSTAIGIYNTSNPGGTLTSFGTYGSGNGQFNNPHGIAVDDNGNVFVADSGNNRIDTFNLSNPSGTFTSFGTYGSGNGQFYGPADVAVDNNGNVFVLDSGNSRIVTLTTKPVPEPTTIGGSLLAGFGLFTLRRRYQGRKKQLLRLNQVQ